MNFYRNPSDNQVYGYDPETQQSQIAAAIGAGWEDVTAAWPPAPSEDVLKSICAATAKQLLSETDFSQLADVSLINKEEFDTYRNMIRALAINPVADPVWPNQPKAVWM